MADRAPRLHDARAVTCRRPNREPPKHGFLRYVAELVMRKIYEDRDAEALPQMWGFLDGEERTRATRSDALESICLVLYCLLAHMQIKSLRVGFLPKERRAGKHDLVGLRREDIADWCRLSESTVSHVLTLLRRSGLLFGPSRDRVNHIAQPCEENDDGTYDWLPAVRRFSWSFFMGLGVDVWLAELRAPSKPKPSTPTVSASSARRLAAELADAHALDGPPDG
jgi:hypothetical protein